MEAQTFKAIRKDQPDSGDVHVPNAGGGNQPKRKAKTYKQMCRVKKGKEVSFLAKISGTRDEERLVFGWASIIENEAGGLIMDSQGDVITPEELEKAAYSFVLDFRKAGEMHESVINSDTLVESFVLTKQKRVAMGLPMGPTGWWIGFKVPDDIFSKVKSGEYASFSIGGSGLRSQIVG